MLQARERPVYNTTISIAYNNVVYNNKRNGSDLSPEHVLYTCLKPAFLFGQPPRREHPPHLTVLPPHVGHGVRCDIPAAFRCILCVRRAQCCRRALLLLGGEKSAELLAACCELAVFSSQGFCARALLVWKAREGFSWSTEGVHSRDMGRATAGREGGARQAAERIAAPVQPASERALPCP